MNPHLAELQPYPFERLRALFDGVEAPADRRPIALSVGEPQNAPPQAVLQAIADNLHLLSRYPATRGSAELRQAIADWMQQRYQIARPDPESQVLPVNGTREALFSIAQACVAPADDALVLSPNPFYQIYEGAALLAGARLYLMDCTQETAFLPDPDTVSEAVWRRCQMLYLCTPGNPSGRVMSVAQLSRFIELALEYDFVLVSDECYSEIYADESQPPPGLLQACVASGNTDFRNCLSFHSLSKRSNLPGLRSGFVAGDAALLQAYSSYRTYHGCAMPPHHQLASTVAWRDEEHVRGNRERYRERFAAVHALLGDLLDVTPAPAGFYLWPQSPVPDTEFARRLYAQENVTVLPGSFLGREVNGRNPGSGRVRIALVSELADCEEAAQRMRRFLAGL